MTVETYNLKASNGKHIRKATKVTLPDGRVIRFTERMPKRAAINQVRLLLLNEMLTGIATGKIQTIWTRYEHA